MSQIEIRPAQLDELDALFQLEVQSFDTDRLSRRSFKHWITTEHRALLVAMEAGCLLGYILVIYHPGTRLARVYSLAVDLNARGRGLGRELMLAGERVSREAGRLYLRLEVSVANKAAIRLYESLGFQRFGLYHDYYGEHCDALRYQKCIRRYVPVQEYLPVPWFRQTTGFTCGPAALMMAMQAIKPTFQATQEQELMIWREATTIFMTSGHGGCHPLGLALAAMRRGFHAEVWLNQNGVLFIDGVRGERKKAIVEVVDRCFKDEAQQQGLALNFANITQDIIQGQLQKGGLALVLISTYNLDRKKVPHWVVVSGFDHDCLYIHDPDLDDSRQSDMDCQYIPIAREAFERMSCFGKNRLRTAVLIHL